MSDGKKPPKVGYKRPPREHQFRPGTSGNPRGRPLKLERSCVPYQTVRDVLAITESLVKVRTSDGVTTATMIEAILRRMAHRALEGHGPSIRLALRLHEDAIRQHYRKHRQDFGFLELWENSPLSETHADNLKLRIKAINRLRRETRRID